MPIALLIGKHPISETDMPEIHHYAVPSGLWRTARRCFSGLLCAFAIGCAAAESDSVPTLRVGVLKFGTVNWSLDTLQAHGLPQKYHFNLQVVPLASADAGTVALQGGAVDVIVSDWLWVNRQRSQGIPVAFVPYSNAIGTVLVRDGSPIREVADLKGHTIGIGGGPSDKTWLLLRAYAMKKSGLDLNSQAKPVYAAPPMLNGLALAGQVDAALNPWQFDARLENHGMHPLISLAEILAGLGIDRPIPLIGWVFHSDWAAQNTRLLQDFLSAIAEANSILAQQDPEWERLRSLMKAEDPATFLALRSGYRKGIPQCTEPDYVSNVTKALHWLSEMGGEKWAGANAPLNDGTFWAGYRLPTCGKK